jgi:DNA-binding NtrC family response regulator
MAANDSILWISSQHPDASERSILHALSGSGPRICGSIAEAAQRVADEPVDLLFANFPVPDGSASDLLARIPGGYGRAPIFIRDPDTSIEDALCLAKLGIEHLLGRDVDAGDVLHRIELCLSDLRSRRKQALTKPNASFPWQRGLVGSGRAMEQVSHLIELVAERRCTVLITGETGTGKEVSARAIHEASRRASGQFVAVNCGALPENLLESELFGHVKGAFTGAQQLRVGRFEQAHHGTLFLDEIGDIPLDLQTKLLRVLQERQFERLGSSETINVDVRIIAATNVDLKDLVKRGQFRQDLYYRLNVVPVHMPALRQRINDIPSLVQHFLAKICKDEGIDIKSVSADGMRSLLNRDWPGNVRQLENAVEMAVAMSGERDLLEVQDFPVPDQVAVNLSASPGVGFPLSLPDQGLDFEQTVSQFEWNILRQALHRTRGNKKQAAEMLRLKRTTLSAKVRILEAAAGVPLI